MIFEPSKRAMFEVWDFTHLLRFSRNVGSNGAEFTLPVIEARDSFCHLRMHKVTQTSVKRSRKRTKL